MRVTRLAALALLAGSTSCQVVAGIDDRTVARSDATTDTTDSSLDAEDSFDTEPSDTGPPETGPSDAPTCDAPGWDAAVPDGGGDGAIVCPDGPYGVEKLYFGPIEDEPTFDASLGTGALSPDGKRFVKSEGAVTDSEGCAGTCFRLREWFRDDLDSSWLSTTSPRKWIVSYVSGWPHLTADNRGLFSCHGGEHKCAFYRRDVVTDAFPFYTTFNFWDLANWNIMMGKGGAADGAFTPTPDGKLIAFYSNRRSPTDDRAEVGSTTTDADLWTAEAIDPYKPQSNYQNLARWTKPSSPTSNDVPWWFSAEGRTLVYVSRAPSDGTFDVWVTTRPNMCAPFDAGTKIKSLSSDKLEEDGFTMPSLEAIAKHGGRGVGYVTRTDAASKVSTYHRFAVCLGTPSP